MGRAGAQGSTGAKEIVHAAFRRVKHGAPERALVSSFLQLRVRVRVVFERITDGAGFAHLEWSVVRARGR